MLDRDLQANAAAARDIESERNGRTAPSGADGVAAENDRLARQEAGCAGDSLR